MKKSQIASVDAYLSPLGFNRRNCAWNRKAGMFVDVIDLQKSKTGNDVTINIGIHNLKLNEQFDFVKDLEFIDEQYCAVRTRFGFLIGDRDIWWNLTEPNLSEILKDSILKIVLPFLDSMHSYASMEHFLTDALVEKKNYPPPIVYLALLRSELGQKVSACSLLMNLRKATSSPWQKRIDDLMEILDCKKLLTSEIPGKERTR